MPVVTIPKKVRCLSYLLNSKIPSFRIYFALSASMVLISSTASLADCTTTAGVMTCTGTPDGFDNVGTWSLGLPGQPKTLINDGTLNPNAAETGMLLFGNGWSIANNGSMLKDSQIAAIIFTFGSTARAQSVIDNKVSGTVSSSNTVGSIVTGYLNSSPTYNLKINNSGQIYQSTASNEVPHPGAIFVGEQSFNISIFNSATGSIVGGDGSNGFHSAISSLGQIDSIQNYGVIKGVGPNASAIYDDNGRIGIINNSGAIQAIGSVAPTAIYLNNSAVTRLENRVSGTIEASGSSGAEGIGLYGAQVGTLVNGGKIIGSQSGIDLDASSVLSSLINTGTIKSTNIAGSGITNSGSIGTLVNLQPDLSYSGVLPTNYSVLIISPLKYGQLAVASPTGVTNFSLYPTSALAQNTTYLNVMSGVTDANFVNGVAPSGRFGTGAMVTQIPWYLSNSGSNWDLITQLSPVQSTNPTIPGSSSGTSLANAIANAGVAASNGGVNPILSGGIPLSGAVQNLTSPQVDALINAHAEGYSSNMTILMERMDGITDATMDRIDGVGDVSNGSIGADHVPGKYLWGELSAYNGKVDSYSDLAGFNYEAVDFMAGADVYHGDWGSFGVFGGGGSTSMTESAQVEQSYDSTNLYAGVYGAAFMSEGLKLSGSAGYMYSNTDATRNVPTIGFFEGGSANDSYSSNGAFAALKLSRSIDAGGSVKITPFFAQSYAQLWVGDVNESGGGDFNFAINSATAYSSVSSIGVDAVVALNDRETDPLLLVGMVRYGYDWFANDDSAHQVTAASPIFGDFVQVGANMGANSLRVASGLQGRLSDTVSVRAGVVGQLNSNGSEIGFGARLRVEF